MVNFGFESASNDVFVLIFFDFHLDLPSFFIFVLCIPLLEVLKIQLFLIGIKKNWIRLPYALAGRSPPKIPRECFLVPGRFSPPTIKSGQTALIFTLA